jgi:hypothetical protein
VAAAAGGAGVRGSRKALLVVFVKRIETNRGAWLFFSACERGFLFYFLFYFLGAGGWISRAEVPFAGFKTASELENVGGKNEEECIWGHSTAQDSRPIERTFLNFPAWRIQGLFAAF